ncbi:acetyl-CoA carboxylase biotin carboxyl carrier protein subunit [Portibacter marinus]|uniref:acetyl-CoA carboxylase biotin carboxyl carrier protein subunit n=1 Tax=Portibacter marinus TaxID=2898660 RepID=UPI001F2301CF|nr:acetyl-CoA carboxylase biotin carboxyl carrier protein subunit [Portibacter marinus]
MSEIKTINVDHPMEGHFQYETPYTIHLRHDQKNYKGVISETLDPKLFEVAINGHTYQIKIQTRLDQLIDEMGLNVLGKKDAGDVFSPMPGLVIDVLVKEGQKVVEDTPLIVLEAMKMENIIKASGNGVVTSIEVETGQKIEKAQLLIRINTEV